MDIELDDVEIRVLGALIEKELTTPDHYPLSLSALTAASNQKSNREPVMTLDESTVQRAVDALMKRHLVTERSGAGSRVPKYAHRLSNKLFETLDFDRRELAVLGVLMLRGPQTAGELRSRTGRMADFEGTDEVEATLSRLAEREDGPYVVELQRRPGQRERRFMHLFGGGPCSEDAVAPPSGPSAGPEGGPRIEALEREVATVKEELARLREEIAALKRGD